MALKMRKNKSPEPPASCPLNRCLSIMGGAWTPNIIWFLSAGPRRFSELKADIPPVSAKVLTTRLKELERKGVIRRTVLPTSPPSVEYALSDLGQELLPVIRVMADVSQRLKEQEGKSAGQSPGVPPPREAS